MNSSNKHPLKKHLHLGLFGLLVGSTLGMFGIQVAFAGKVAPATSVLNMDVGMEDAGTVQENYSKALDAYEQTPITVEFKGETYTFALADLGVEIKKTESVENIPVMGPGSSWMLQTNLLAETNPVEAAYELDEEQLLTGLEEQIINLNVAAAEPIITWNPYLGDFEITPEQSGWEADLAAFEEALDEGVKNLDSITAEIEVTQTVSKVTAEELEASKDLLNETLSENTTIFTDTDEWTINWKDNLHLLNFEPVEGGGIVIDIDNEIMKEHIAQYIAPEVEVASQDVTILMDDEGDISFEGTAVDGLAIEYDNLNEFLEIALSKGVKEVEIPLTITQGQVNAPDELKERGITELVVTGYSNYYGSPYNRRHNISVAISQFDGVIIEPGETFVFGETLGPVDGSTGYAKELVIKENETIPEYGGGVCQVSSTLFRAILFGGYPIVERHAHSYAVGYYAYPLGWGLDATVYPPSVDLQFLNDSDTPILIQSYVEDNDAYFKFYGTKDGRQTVMDGPYTSNYRGAPAAIYTVTSELPAGTIQQKDSAHNGFTASWTRTVSYPDGTVIEEEIISPYQAWPARYLVGEGTEGYGEESED